MTPPATCTDQIKNGSETDIDCGGSGSCAACAPTKACLAPTDCASGVCTGAVCQAPSCSDTVQNGNESDADCGGSCGPCTMTQKCRLGQDCGSGSCSNAGVCLAYTCNDGVRNNDETDIDCGGSCNKCPVLHGCLHPSDCNTSVCGTNGTCRALPTCKDLHQDPSINSGTYYLDPGKRTADEIPMPAYCDMTTDGGGWTLVYKASAGVTLSSTAVWNNGAVRNEKFFNYANPLSQPDHYLNRLGTSEYWNANGISYAEVRVAAYTAGVENAFIQFNSITQDRTNWFARSNIAKSTWTDITTAPANFFSINGDQTPQRGWFANSFYFGCPGDAGWLKVGEPGAGPCPWDNNYGPHTDIVYANFSVNQNWLSGMVGRADALLVFVR